MCSVPEPKIPDPAPPPPPPPAPTKMATKIANPALKSRRTNSKKRGTSSLTVQRQNPTVNTGSSGSGANISY